MLVSFSILAIRSAVKLNILIYQGPPLSRRTPPEGTRLWNTLRRLRNASKNKETQACTAAAALQKEPPASKTIEKQSQTKQKLSKTKPEQQPPLSRRAAGICSSLVLLCFSIVFDAGGSFWRAAAAVQAWFSLVLLAFQRRRGVFQSRVPLARCVFTLGGVLLERGGP